MSIKWARLVLRIGLPVLALGLMNGFAFLMQLKFVNMIGIVAATAFSIGFQTILPTLPFFSLFSVALSIGRGSGHTLFPTTLGILRLLGV